MKRIRFINILALVCLFMLILSSCGKRLTVQDGGGAYYDKKQDIKYCLAPMCYEPIMVKEDIYAKSGKTEFHEIVGADPEKWLCQANGAVFYAEGEEIPALDEMNISSIYVKQEVMTIAILTDTEKIKAIMDKYLTGESIVYYNYEPKTNWSIKFADTSLGIYYSVSYLEYDEDYIVEDDNGVRTNYGKKFLYDIYNGIFVTADGLLDDVVESYYGGIQEESEVSETTETK